MAKKKPTKSKPMKPAQTERARKVLDYATSSVNNFLTAFDTVRSARGATGRGAPTDEEQDLVRAALVFAAAGLDSALKQLIRHTLPTLSRADQNVRREFEVFVQRQLKGESEDTQALSGHKFLARVLTAQSMQEQLLAEYIADLTGSSLQSASQLTRTVKALGLDPQQLGVVDRDLSPIFSLRNKIIHELDVNLSGGVGQRKRSSRTYKQLEEASKKLLEIGKAIVTAVDKNLK